MMNYDMQQALCVSPSPTNNNNPNRSSSHLYYQQQHHLHQQQQHHHRLKNEPFSPPNSHGLNNSRSAINDTNSSSNHPMSKTPIPQQQRPVNYVNSSTCSEPSLKHARFDPPVWPNTT